MSSDSKIEWTTHTFNPWWGCARVSPACEHCYAETFAKRLGFGGANKPSLWGPAADRRIASDAYWRQPFEWDRKASARRERHRVFCASMADVFEDRRDLDEARELLWNAILETAHLDWLLLTKRIECVRKIAPWRRTWPANVWLGATVEDQRRADERIPHLIEHPAAVRFLSVEPLLGPVDVGPYLQSIDWVICGGESGGGARPMRLDWVRDMRDQCVAAGVPFFFKQWGQFGPGNGVDLVRMRQKGTRLLDGRTWDEVPQPRAR